jgi:hypothetical protein
MAHFLKLIYVMLTPVVLVFVFEQVIVTNWSKWVAATPLLEGVPSWLVLAVAAAIYAANVWMVTKTGCLDGLLRPRGQR